MTVAKPYLLVITGPSGVGKSYLAQSLLESHPELFEIAKLHTTRPRREGEIISDRIFITPEDFATKTASDEFIIQDAFHDHRYGYTESSLRPEGKHLIVNAWPALLPAFAEIPRARIIGLTVDQSDVRLLGKRMLDRGDNQEKVQERLEFVRRDIRDLDRLHALVENSGKVFKVQGNETIPNLVIPWILGHVDN